MAPVTDVLTAARAEALFSSTLPTGAAVSRADTQWAITAAVRRHGGVRGCAALVAVHYGDYPQTAVRRMRWARGVVDRFYPVRCPAHPRSRR
jgi:hypothetical protein